MVLLPDVTTEIPLEKIILGSSQARQRDTTVNDDDDLVLSIRKHGMLSPIIVKKTHGEKYELLVGQRRFRAHEILKKTTIRAYVTESNMDEYGAKTISLIENLARKDMKRPDYVDAVQWLMNKYRRVSDVADELGVSKGTIYKYLHIGRLPLPIQEDINNKKYSADHALRALDALGGDEITVDTEKLRETSESMKQLSLPAQKKFVDIKKHEPDASNEEIVKKAKSRTVQQKFTLDIPDIQLGRIHTFKESKGMDDVGIAVVELIDIGLDASEV